MKDMNDKVIVAADGGGTGCRAAAGTMARGILGQAAGGPGNVHSDFDGALANLTGAVAAALAEAGLADIQLSEITAHFGVAGAHSEEEMTAVAKALPYGASSVTGDRATSVRGALGSEDGYVVALGTGTIVARQSGLEMTTIGGWGFDLSDQASGAWLGKRLLRETVKAVDGLQPHTALTSATLEKMNGLFNMIYFATDAAPGDFAPLARDVVPAAAEGDAVALKLMQEGAAYVSHGLRSLGMQEGDVLALGGGLGPHYAPYLPKELTANIISPKGTALEGAFAMASDRVKSAL